MLIKKFTDLEAWKKAHALALAVYVAVADFARLNSECDEVGRLIGGLSNSLRKRVAT